MNFKDYSYKADFKLQKHKNMAIFDEKFKSEKSGHVRENQHTMYMEKQKEIVIFINYRHLFVMNCQDCVTIQ